MKKTMSIFLAVLTALALIMPAPAEEEPVTDGGMKFESDWAMMNGLIGIVYEEEGYRVLVDLFDQDGNAGVQWEYNCFYNEEEDVLESFSSVKTGYVLDPDTLDITRGECEYEGIDDEDTVTVFALTDDGALIWLDGRENMGADLEFTDIGTFEGVWKNEEEDVYAEIWWQGLYDEGSFFYSVYIGRGLEEGYAEFHMDGRYDPETGKLAAAGTADVTIDNGDGTYTRVEDGETCEAFFSDRGDGTILLEADGGIVLEYDILGPES